MAKLRNSLNGEKVRAAIFFYFLFFFLCVRVYVCVRVCAWMFVVCDVTWERAIKYPPLV